MMYQPMTQMKGKTNIRFVNIPEMTSRAGKGETKYDEWFINCVENKTAMQIPDDEFDSIRKAAFRFLKFRKLDLSIRQKKDSKTKSYVMWFLDKPKEEKQ